MMTNNLFSVKSIYHIIKKRQNGLELQLTFIFITDLSLDYFINRLINDLLNKMIKK